MTDLDQAVFSDTVKPIDSLWLNQPSNSQRTILYSYAHPDDESFGNAGSISRYADEGVAVHYACATRGECGTVDPALLEGYDDIAALRTSELHNAARIMKMSGVHLLGYRDSGMQGSPDNQHPNALVQAPLDQVAAQVTAIIRKLKPQVVVTFSPYGGYGHPDHIFMHHATMRAFHAANDPNSYPEQLAAGLSLWQPQRLFYSTMGTGLLRAALWGMRLSGKNPRKMGVNQDIDFVRVVEEATPIHTSVRTGKYYDQNREACRAHRSQYSGGMSILDRIPKPVRQMLSREHFTQVVPDPSSARIHDDLFAGL
jgi:LmbE family N-acetylglucosaminyl deacetylase